MRGVAQPGSAPEWGSGGRRFKSSRPDQLIKALPDFVGGAFSTIGPFFYNLPQRGDSFCFSGTDICLRHFAACVAGERLSVVPTSGPFGVRQGFRADVMEVSILDARSGDDSAPTAVPAADTVWLAVSGAKDIEGSDPPLQLFCPLQSTGQGWRHLEGHALTGLALTNDQGVRANVCKRLSNPPSQIS